MAYIQRIALLLLFLIPSVWSGSALADYPKTFLYYEGQKYKIQSSTYQPICANFVAQEKLKLPNETPYGEACSESQARYSTYYIGYNHYTETIKKFGSCSGVISEWGNGMCAGSCTAPYTMVNGVCTPPPTCQAPLVLDPATNTCKDLCLPKAGQDASYFTTNGSSPTACVDGCVVNMTEGQCGYNASGQQGCFFTGTFTGSSCSGTQTPTGVPPSEAPKNPEYDCVKQGKSWGTVNGTVVCVAAGTSGSSPTTSTKPPSSSQSTSGGKNADGTDKAQQTTTESKKETTTFNGDGTATTTTTTTTTNPDGSTSTQQQQKTETMSDFCKANPKAAACVQADQGSFGGSCGSFSCTGDAAQCALAKEVHQRNCEFYVKDTDMESAFNALKSGNNETGSVVTKETVSVVSSLDSTSNIAASCPPDKVIQFYSHSFTMPISEWCPYLEALGYVFLALAYIAAARIIGGAV